MRCTVGSLLFACIASVLGLPAPAQQAPNDFRWIDFHSPADQDTVVWVERSLDAEKWTAIREIGVQFDAALVVTTLRATPQSITSTDTFSVWSVSLTNRSVIALLKGVNLRLLDWMLFAQGQPRELGALYDDCHECNASTYFTAFYYDIRQHGWATRWMRGAQSIPISTSNAPPGVKLARVYAVLADPNGHEFVATWNHFDYGDQKPGEDFVYQYDVDPWNGLDRTEILNGKDADAMKRRLCLATDTVSGLAHGQDSILCVAPVKPPTPHRATRKPSQ
jgi:hypothetical protein